MAPIARHVIRPGFDTLPMPAGRTDGVCEWEDASQSFNHARLAAHDRPALGRMIADLEEAAVHRDIVAGSAEADGGGRGEAPGPVPNPPPPRKCAPGRPPSPPPPPTDGSAE